MILPLGEKERVPVFLPSINTVDLIALNLFSLFLLSVRLSMKVNMEKKKVAISTRSLILSFVIDYKRSAWLGQTTVVGGDGAHIVQVSELTAMTVVH